MGFWISLFVGVALGIGFISALVRLMKAREEKRLTRTLDTVALNRLDVEDFKKLFQEGNPPPTWVSFAEFEKVNWLNAQLTELWPYINKATSNLVKETVEPMLEEMCPVGVQSLKFKKFTLGNIAPQIAGIKVHAPVPSQVILDIDLKWGGDPSIILALTTVALAVLPVQLKDLKLFATLRIIFQLGDELPCIAAVVTSFLAKPKPVVQYKLKAVGGSLTAIPGLAGMIDEIVQSSVGAFVWPQRMVSAIAANFDTSHLELRQMGALFVTVERASNLKNVDLIGKSDPYVTLWTRMLEKQKTRVIDNSLNPVWGEKFELPVDDPLTTQLVLKVQDSGMMSNEALGWALLRLSDLGETEVEEEVTLQLVPELENDRTKGKDSGLGSITIKVKYHPFNKEEQEEERKRRKGEQQLQPQQQQGEEAAEPGTDSTTSLSSALLVSTKQEPLMFVDHLASSSRSFESDGADLPPPAESPHSRVKMGAARVLGGITHAVENLTHHKRAGSKGGEDTGEDALVAKAGEPEDGGHAGGVGIMGGAGKMFSGIKQNVGKLTHRSSPK